MSALLNMDNIDMAIKKAHTYKIDKEAKESRINSIPLSLYIHIPWCIKKCPYCDFNSYAQNTETLAEADYIEVLTEDLAQELLLLEQLGGSEGKTRPFNSIFFGGGTPSLFSGKSIGNILEAVNKLHPFSSDIEITLEANPGTIEHTPFIDYRAAGINRISLGAQSFQDDKLKALGRVHQTLETQQALTAIQKAKFNSFNIDIMYGLPNQNLADARFDLETALQYSPPHLSWYNLTLEPNTVFHNKPPELPQEDVIWEMQNLGFEILSKHGFKNYEVSAFAKPGFECQHNLNYWQFGDYLGIGAGAHGKITRTHTTPYIIHRRAKTRFPKNYLEAKSSQRFCAKEQTLSSADILFEFMLNSLRLSNGFSRELFETRTGFAFNVLEPMLEKAKTKGLLCLQNNQFQATELGKRFLNDLVSLFLPKQ